MNNSIIRLARLQISQQPNDIVKVAGILNRIKRWVLQMFDPNVRQQIGIIDSKYADIKGLIRLLQDNIVSIEKSIENVDVVGYDANVVSLGKTLEKLSEKINDTKDAIQSTTSASSRNMEFSDNSNSNVVNFFKRGETLASLGVTRGDLDYRNDEMLYNSIRGYTSNGTVLGRGNPHILRFFDGDKDTLERFIDKLRTLGFANKIVANDIINKYKIVAVKEPIEKSTPPRMINVGLLKVRGWSNVNVDGDDYEIDIQVFLDIFLSSSQDIAEVAKDGRYHVFKQFVWNVRRQRPAVYSKEVEIDKPKDVIESLSTPSETPEEGSNE